MDFDVPADNRVKIKENDKRGKYLNLARELKKAMEHEGDGDPNCNCWDYNGPQMLNVDRLYVPRKGERVLTSIQDNFDASI